MLHTHSVLIKSPPSIQYVICTSQWLLMSTTLLLGSFSYDIVLPRVECVCRYVGICVCVLGLRMHGCMCVSSHKCLCVSAQWHCPLLRGGRITQPRAEFDNDVLHNAYAECLLICDGAQYTFTISCGILLKNKQETQIHIGILPFWHSDK